MRATIRATAGSITAAIRRPIIAARSTTLGLTPLHRRSFGLVREIEAREAQPELVFDEIAPGESFESHHQRLSPPTLAVTQHLVVAAAPGRLSCCVPQRRVNP